MILNENEFKKCSLSAAQLKAAKAVYKAMKSAGKLGVHFWDDYGTMRAYNNRAITMPVPEAAGHYDLSENPVTYYEVLSNFHNGNADDSLYFNIK